MQLSPEEESYFRYLWGILDPQGIGSANARDTVQFFKRSQLPSDKLKSIWLLSVTNNENKLYPNEFFTALKYIALCQNGFELSPQLLQQQVRLPQLDGIPPQPAQELPKPVASMYQTMPVNSSYQPQLIQQAQQFSQTQFDISNDQLEKYCQHYAQQDKQQQGFIDGETARTLFQKSGLTVQILTELWALVDTGHKGFLYKYEYIVAIHLISLCRRNIPLPTTLPESMQKLIQQSQPQQSVIINEIKPSLSQNSTSRVPSGSTVTSELPGLQQQSQQLQNQLTQLVLQFPNYSNNNAQKQALDSKQKELEFYVDQVNRLQVIFDSLKQQEIDLKSEIEKINAFNAKNQQQQQQQKQPIPNQPVYNPPKLETNFNIYPPLQSEAPYKQQQVNLTLDDGFNQYKAQQQTEEVPW